MEFRHAGTATIVAGGLATAVNPGQTVITATEDGVSGDATLTVTDAVKVGFAVVPSVALSSPGTSRQYRAIVTFSDMSTEDVTSRALWSSSDSEVTIANDNIGPNKPGRASIDLTAATGQTINITATFGVDSADASLSLGTFAYSARRSSGFLNVFSQNSLDGTLTAEDNAPVESGCSDVAVDPAGRFLYVTSSDNDRISVLSIDPQDGTPTEVGEAVTTGDKPEWVAVHPDGRFVYVTNEESASLSVFTVDSVSGALSPLGDPVVVGSLPNHVVVDPTGQFVYVLNRGSGTVSAFTVNPDTGVLTAAGTPAGTGNNPVFMVVDPTGRFVYVANFSDPSVSVFSIAAATGVLTQVSVVPTSGALGHQIAVDPTGRFLYVAHQHFTNAPVSTQLFTINQMTGDLEGGSVQQSGNIANLVTVDPLGRFAYIFNIAGSSLTLYAIDSVTGALTAGAALGIGSSFPRPLVFTP